MDCKHQVLKEKVVWRTAASTLVLQYPLATDGATSDLQGTHKMICCIIAQLRHWSSIHTKRCGGVCLFFKKLNTLYLKLFSGKIYLVFWGFEKAECFLTLECLCPCSNGSYYTCRKRSRAPEPHCPQPGVPVCTSQGCSEMTEHQHFGYCSDHLSNWEQYLQVETQILVFNFNPSLALSFL